MHILSIAWRNLFRNWHRTLVTTLAMGFAGFIMILFAALMEGLIVASERNAVIMDVGDIQIHAKGYREDPDLYKRIANAPELLERLHQAGYFATQRLFGFALAAAGNSSAGVQLRGVDLRHEATVTQINKHVMQGEWLDREKPHGVVIGKKLARTLNVGPGDEVVIVGQAADGSMANELYQVNGILKSVGEQLDRGGFFMLAQSFRELMVLSQGAHEITIMRPDRTTDLAIATDQVSNIAPNYEVMNWRGLRPVIARLLDLADAQTVFMILITYVAVAMVVLNAMLMSVFERIHEFGVMKALGVTPWQLIRLIYSETFLQVLIASLVALFAGWWAADYLAEHGIDLSAISSGTSFGGIALDPIWEAQLTANALWLPIVFLFLIALLAVAYPALKAAFIKPVDAIHYR